MNAAVVQVPPDIWHRILSEEEELTIYDIPAANLLPLSMSCHYLQDLLQVYLYRHVNLRTVEKALAFFDTLLTPAHNYHDLAAEVLTLQFSFTTHDESSSEGGPIWDLFWDQLASVMRLMSALKTLNICYSLHDDDCLHRFIMESNLQDCVPASLETVHLKPLPGTEFGSLTRIHSVGPWNGSSWPVSISLIPTITTLIVTSPTYILWPLTAEQLLAERNRWTAQFRHHGHRANVNLSTILLNFGTVDEGNGYEQAEQGLHSSDEDREDDDGDGDEGEDEEGDEEEEEDGDGGGEEEEGGEGEEEEDSDSDDSDAVDVPAVFEPKGIIDGHLYGIQFAWTKEEDDTWEETTRHHVDEREAYFFGPSGGDKVYDLPFFHVDEEGESESEAGDDSFRPRRGVSFACGYF
ncbi:hypothetical protein R3P38DRAFT_1127485 [Favolaschia claudopus]|uniref:F-box domain-containing protein n=1 Tax=Favolaschia claudopus TaxID=2862362 RepID=A0AAW0B611_9AGAR